jgi:putative transposase
LPASTKTVYHPNIVTGYFLKILPVDILKQIPRSTKYDWDKKQQCKMFGADSGEKNTDRLKMLELINSNDSLLKINRALIKIIAIKTYIARHDQRIKDGVGKADKVVLTHIKKVSEVLGLNAALSYLQVTKSFYRSLCKVKKCSFSSINLCRVKHPNQLLEKQVTVIKDYSEKIEYAPWTLSSVFHQILRDETAYFCKSTFYKYVNLLGIQRFKPVSRRTNHKTGKRATRCFEILHADITEFKTNDNKKAYIYLVIDNYSRSILAWQISLIRRASITFENLEKVCDKYLLPAEIKNFQLVTDNGVENCGIEDALKANCIYPLLTHLIPNINFDFSNSIIEYTNRRLKYEYL